VTSKTRDLLENRPPMGDYFPFNPLENLIQAARPIKIIEKNSTIKS
jgi:hypothetical protein